MKNNPYLPIFLWILLVLFLASPTLAQKEDKLQEDDIEYYKDKMIRKANMAGKIFSLIGERNNLKKNMPTYMRKLDQIFEDQRSPIYHAFVYEQNTKGYSYGEFVKELTDASIEYVNFNWVIIGQPYVMPNGKDKKPINPSTVRCLSKAAKGKKVCNDWIMEIDDNITLKKKGARLPFQFDKTLFFSLTEGDLEGEWHIKINRIKSTNNKLKAPGVGDKDGDSVPDNIDECEGIKGSPDCFGCIFVDVDGDGICDKFDTEIASTSSGGSEGNESGEGEGESDTITAVVIRKGPKIFAPPLPSFVDYKMVKLDARLKGKPHWLWAGGVLGSYGLSGYYFNRCNQDYQCRKLPKVFREGNFATYRQAKLDRQNAVIMASIGTSIWLVDLLQALRKKRKLKKAAGKDGDLGQVKFFLDTESFPNSTLGYAPIVGLRYQW